MQQTKEKSSASPMINNTRCALQTRHRKVMAASHFKAWWGIGGEFRVMPQIRSHHRMFEFQRDSHYWTCLLTRHTIRKTVIASFSQMQRAQLHCRKKYQSTAKVFYYASNQHAVLLASKSLKTRNHLENRRDGVTIYDEPAPANQSSAFIRKPPFRMAS